MGVSIQLHASVTLLPTEIDPAGFQRRSGNFGKKKKRIRCPYRGSKKDCLVLHVLVPQLDKQRYRKTFVVYCENRKKH